jgi:hypothetical protein
MPRSLPGMLTFSAEERMDTSFVSYVRKREIKFFEVFISWKSIRN